MGDVLEDIKLTTLAFAIAIGWSIYQVAAGVAQLVDGLTTHVSNHEFVGTPSDGMTWIVSNRVLTLDRLVTGLIELAVALAIAAFVRSRYSYMSPPPDADVTEPEQP